MTDKDSKPVLVNIPAGHEKKGYTPASPSGQFGYQAPTGQHAKPPVGGSAVKPPPAKSK